MGQFISNLDIDWDDIYFSTFEKQQIINELWDEGLRPENSAIDQDFEIIFDGYSFTELELDKLFRRIITDKSFITSDKIKRINDILDE